MGTFDEGITPLFFSALLSSLPTPDGHKPPATASFRHTLEITQRMKKGKSAHDTILSLSQFMGIYGHPDDFERL